MIVSYFAAPGIREVVNKSRRCLELLQRSSKHRLGRRKAIGVIMTQKKDKAHAKASKIIFAIDAVTGYDMQDLKSKCRKHPKPLLRQIFSKLMYVPGVIGVSEIGRIIDKDHTTILHHIETANGLLETEDERFLGFLNPIMDYYLRME